MKIKQAKIMFARENFPFLFHFKIKFCWISPKPVTGYIAKKGSHFEKKME
jgi:hypothetical protein